VDRNRVIGGSIIMAQQVSHDRKMSPLLLLTAATGLVDAVSYIGLGHVFTANMTGNVVLLGFAFVGTPGLSVFRSLTALVAFLIGGVLGGRIFTRLAAISTTRWITASFGSEAIFLLAATAVSVGFRPLINVFRLYVLIVLTGLAMGVRNATVRKLAVPDLTTTVLTLTISGLAADSSLAGGSNPRWQRRVLSILVMLSGAALGARLSRLCLALPLGLATVSALCSLAAFYAERQELGTVADAQKGTESTRSH
jgi:uncharacterized membrane protein YoaK (UPF0700 family)